MHEFVHSHQYMYMAAEHSASTLLSVENNTGVVFVVNLLVECRGHRVRQDGPNCSQPELETGYDISGDSFEGVQETDRRSNSRNPHKAPIRSRSANLCQPTFSRSVYLRNPFVQI